MSALVSEPLPLVYTLAELAAMFHCSERTIVRWEEQGFFPHRLDFAGIRVYDRGEVDAWFASRHRKAG